MLSESSLCLASGPFILFSAGIPVTGLVRSGLHSIPKPHQATRLCPWAAYKDQFHLSATGSQKSKDIRNPTKQRLSLMVQKPEGNCNPLLLPAMESNFEQDPSLQVVPQWGQLLAAHSAGQFTTHIPLSFLFLFSTLDRKHLVFLKQLPHKTPASF